MRQAVGASAVGELLAVLEGAIAALLQSCYIDHDTFL